MSQHAINQNGGHFKDKMPAQYNSIKSIGFKKNIYFFWAVYKDFITMFEI